MENNQLEKHAHVSHIIMGYSATALFITLICVLLYFVPKVNSLLITGQQAASNINTASGIWANASKDEAKQVHDMATDARTTIIKLNRETIPAIDNLVNTSNAQVEQIGVLTQTLNSNVQDTDSHVNELLESLKTTSDGANVDLATLSNSLESIKPLLDNSNKSVIQLNQLLDSKDLNQAIAGLAQTSQNAGKISNDLYSFEHPILNPNPCKTKGCRFKRNVWPYIKGTLLIGSEAHEVYEWFSPIPVTIKK